MVGPRWSAAQASYRGDWRNFLPSRDCPVLTTKFVVELLVEGDRCVGVTTSDGDVYRARKGVVSSAAVQQLLTMAPEGSLPEDFTQNLKQWKTVPAGHVQRGLYGKGTATF